MNIPIRKAARVLLINDHDELLLIYVEAFDIKTTEGKSFQRFWFTVGGGIEPNESVEQAAIREIYEETGIPRENITLGPIVWHGTAEVILKGQRTLLDESYIVAKTIQKNVALLNPTNEEQNVIKKLKWFSLEEIKQIKDPIFPISLAEYLPNILQGDYPNNPIEINLS